jgi:hypothetical protein
MRPIVQHKQNPREKTKPQKTITYDVLFSFSKRDETLGPQNLLQASNALAPQRHKPFASGWPLWCNSGNF